MMVRVARDLGEGLSVRVALYPILHVYTPSSLTRQDSFCLVEGKVRSEGSNS